MIEHMNSKYKNEYEYKRLIKLSSQHLIKLTGGCFYYEERFCFFIEFCEVHKCKAKTKKFFNQ